MNEYVMKIQGSASMELMAKAKELRGLGIKVIGLGGGEPDFDTPQRIKNRAIEELNKGNTHYAVGKGLPELRCAICDKLKKDNGIRLSEENIIVTPGAKFAIYLAVRSCINIGDEVLIPTPSWVSYSEIVRSAGGVPITVKLDAEDHYRITAKELERHYTDKTRMLILNSPNNPTGRMIDEKEMEEIVHFESDKSVIVLSDEVYEKIAFDGRKHLSPAAIPGLFEKTITVNGFSKAYAMTGWRIGYIAAPEKYICEISKLYTHTVTGLSPFIQMAAVAALGCDEETEIMRKSYEERRDWFISELNQIPGVQADMPEGAFYAWTSFKIPGVEPSEVANYLLEKAQVIAVPGVAYGEENGQHVRFSFANKKEDLEEAITRIRCCIENCYNH